VTGNNKKNNLILFVIIIVAGLVRYWGIAFCLPNTECSIEEKIIINIATQFGSGDLNPHFFFYPTLYMYALFFLDTGYFLLGRIIGKYTSVVDFITEFAVNPSNFYIISRGFAALLGTATVYIVYKIAIRLFDKKTAIISSLFLALAYSHVRQSHLGTTDIPMVFLVCVSLLFIIKSYEDKTLKSYIGAGIFAGLATSTKYFAFPLPVSMFVVHFLNIYDINGKKLTLFFDKKMLFFFSAFLIAFLLGTPFALLDFPDFISFLKHQNKLMESPWGINLGKGWWYHMRYSLFYGLGWPLFFASLMGILISIKIDRRKTIILCSFPLVYYFIAGKIYWVFIRYSLPLIPFFCITGAVFAGSISEKFKHPFNKILTFLIPLLIVSPSTYNIIRSNDLLTRKDNRLIVAEWINKSIPAGSSIYQSGVIFGKIQIYPTLESLEEMYKDIISKGDKGRMLKAQIEYYRRNNIHGYEVWTYDVRLRKFRFRSEEKDALPDYIILQESPLIAWSRTPVEVEQLSKSYYKLIKSFEVTDISNQENWFDLQDSLYLPFVGFKNIQRPGPNIYIYKRN
jgi:hypothetical protein